MALLRLAWHKSPDQRFGQFVVNLAETIEIPTDGVWYVEDDAWIEALQDAAGEYCWTDCNGKSWSATWYGPDQIDQIPPPTPGSRGWHDEHGVLNDPERGPDEDPWVYFPGDTPGWDYAACGLDPDDEDFHGVWIILPGGE